MGAGTCFGFDVREHWIAQAEFLKRQLGGDGMTFEVRRIEELASLGLPRFDISFFNGIFYHLPDPAGGLKAAADLTNELLVLNTAMIPAAEKALILSMESPTRLMSPGCRAASRCCATC